MPHEHIDSVFRLHFGIPSIDELIGDARKEQNSPRTVANRQHHFGLGLPKRSQRDENFQIVGEPVEAPIASSVNILGADGSGKSILALHLVSAYKRDLLLNGQAHAKIVYASSDLGWERARDSWDTFNLGEVFSRTVPFEEPAQWERPDGIAATTKVNLFEVQPRNEVFHGRLHEANDPTRPEVLFLDLASTTAGDDWGLINRLLGILSPIDSVPPAPAEPSYEWPHMLVIDAVEGLETMVGEVDAYGLESTRRSRLAQLMQLAAGKCHIVLVNELRHDRDRLDEEFVTDLVIKLKMTHRDGYSHRLIEVVKARSQSIVRGDHSLTIRGGAQGGSEREPWLDVPKSDNAYIHCFHNVDTRDRRLPEIFGESNETRRAGFGITYLDSMLGTSPKPEPIRRGSLTALLGDEATHKSKLARAFLANGFAKEGSREVDDEANWEVGICLTIGDWNKASLARRIACHLDGPVDAERLEPYLFVRRLEISTLSSAVLAHIVEQLIREAKTLGRPIRFVIDDLSTMKSVHPVLAQDHKLLPHLVRYLKSEQVTSLIADNFPGRPLSAGEREPHVLQGLAHRVVYTWMVPFFNEHRVAITTLAPTSSDSEVVIRELRPTDGGGPGFLERMEVDPHFELYADIDQAEPQLVPLQVMLRVQGEASDRYLRETERSLDFNFLRPSDKPSILHLGMDQYDELRAMASGRASYRLDQTTVLQVDEFWAHSKSDGLYDVRSYLEECTDTPMADPTRSFDVRLSDQHTGPQQRRHFFDDPLGSKCAHPATRLGDVPPGSDRLKVVPYYWDLGFLLLDYHAWTAAVQQFDWIAQGASEAVMSEVAYKRRLVTETSQALTIEKGRQTQPVATHSATWRRLLRACQFVAGSAVSSENHEILSPFDLELGSPESFSSLILEMWASEIMTSLEGGKAVELDGQCISANEFSEKLATKSDRGEDLVFLAWMVKHFRLELFLVWLLLVEVIDAEDFLNPESLFDFQNRPVRPNAVAMRHWYSSASEFMRGRRGDHYQVARLPGRFTTRGDWFLAIARSSRSRRLGQKAIDQMTSRRANVTRLQQGVGLPVRRLDPGEELGSDFQRTAIPYMGVDGNIQMSLKTFIERTCPSAHLQPGGEVPQSSPSFGWLWRSNIQGYHHDSRIFGRWLFTTLGWFSQIKHKRAAGWRNGFRLYDRTRLFFEVIDHALIGETQIPEPQVHEAQLLERLNLQWLDLQDREVHRMQDGSIWLQTLLADDHGTQPSKDQPLPTKFTQNQVARANHLASDLVKDLQQLDSFQGFSSRCEYLQRLLETARPHRLT